MKDYNEIIERIGTHIKVDNKKNVVSACILASYINRMKYHIGMVRDFARVISMKFHLRPWASSLMSRVALHDHDKLDDPVLIGDYAPYIIKKYGPEWLKNMFEVDEDYPRQWQTIYLVQHIKANPHHAEHWCKEYDYGENTPPYDVTDMDDVSIAEMCCDWMAAGTEQGNTASEWNKTIGKERYIFKMPQLQLIENILSFEDEFRNRLGLQIEEKHS